MRLLFVICLSVLGGCTTVSETVSTPDATVPSSPNAPVDAPVSQMITPATNTSPAVLKLLEQARAATQEGNLPRAEVLLERSIRIEPKNPTLWHYLAKVRLEQGRFNEAAGLAQKSISFSKDDKALQADNWRIIAHARNRSGDVQGAREAQERVNRLMQ